MKLRRRLLATAMVAAAVVFVTPASKALVSLEDGRDHIFVTGTFGVAYDSNVFANKESGGSVTYSTGILFEFVRRAGWISVNATVDYETTEYASFRAQNFADPRFMLELDKQSGRTTGVFTVTAQRIDQADIAASTRDTSWNYDAGLNFHYPVIERYSIAGSFDYDYIDYVSGQAFLKNLSTETGKLDLYYILTDERDLFATYRYRDSQVGGGATDVDNAILAGINGHVVGKINGAIQAGYEVRTSRGAGTSGTYPDLTANATLTWAYSKQLSIYLNLSRDFSTVSTGTSTETTALTSGANYSMNAKLSFVTGLSLGQSKFLGAGGLTPSGKQRIDEFFSWNVGVNYTLNQHLKVFLGYTRSENWSTLALAEYPRSLWNLSLTSRW